MYPRNFFASVPANPPQKKLNFFELVSKIATKKTPKPILSVLANILAELQAKQTPSKLLANYFGKM